MSIIHPDTNWYQDRGYKNMYLVQSNYQSTNEVVFNTSHDINLAKIVAGIGPSSVAIFKVTKKIFVNQNGELI